MKRPTPIQFMPHDSDQGRLEKLRRLADQLAEVLGTISGAQGPVGPTGPAGATGAPGATGPQGPAGAPVTLTNGSGIDITGTALDPVIALNAAALASLALANSAVQPADLDTWLATKTTSNLVEGSNLYFTDERAQDAVGLILTDSPSIDLTYDDALGVISADVDQSWAATWTANHRWTDNDEVQLGTGGDLVLYHDGTNSHIDSNTGDLLIDGDVIASGQWVFTSTNRMTLSSTDCIFGFNETDGSVGNTAWGIRVNGETMFWQLYTDGFAAGTTFVQINRTGSVLDSWDFVSGQVNIAGTLGNSGNPVKMGDYLDLNNSRIIDTVGDIALDGDAHVLGHLVVDASIACRSDSEAITAGAGDDFSFYFDGTDGYVVNTAGDLLIRNAANEHIRFATNNTNRWMILRTGHLWGIADNTELQLGAGVDLRLYHDGTDSWVNNDTGNLNFDTPGVFNFTGGTVVTIASTTSESSVRLPHGAAPSSPVDGDMWTTTAGLFVRINGATIGPLT
jgi:hypothetical protein